MTTENVNRDKLLARMRKMLALANDSAATDGERNAAMSQIYTILAKYNLSLSDVEQADTVDDRGEQVGESHGGPWVRTVCFGIAQLFFCTYFYTRTRTGTKHHFIGREANSVTARELAMFVYRSIEREGQARYRGDTPSRTSFAKGAAGRIYSRCEAMRAEAERADMPASAPGTALVLASMYRTEEKANEDWLAAHNMVVRAAKDRQKRSVNSDAFHAGKAYGDSVNLSRQIKGNTTAPAGRIK